VLQKYKIFFFIWFLILVVSVSKAQEDEVYYSHFRLETRINVLAPRALSNKAFNSTFNGIYTVSGSENIHLFQGFYVGICGGNSLYQVPEYSVVSGPAVNNATPYINTSCEMNFLGLNIGRDYYFSPKSFLSTAISIGQNYTKFTDVEYVNKVPISATFNTVFIELSTGINFGVEDHAGIGFMVDYIYLNHQFNPGDIALNQYIGYGPGSANGNISLLEFGFVVHLEYLKRKVKMPG